MSCRMTSVFMKMLALGERQSMAGSPVQRGQFRQLSGGKIIKLTANYPVWLK